MSENEFTEEEFIAYVEDLEDLEDHDNPDICAACFGGIDEKQYDKLVRAFTNKHTHLVVEKWDGNSSRDFITCQICDDITKSLEFPEFVDYDFIWEIGMLPSVKSVCVGWLNQHLHLNVSKNAEKT